MVSAEDVIGIYHTLKDEGIQIWLTGGWGIDALLGEQTRLHEDLDVYVLLKDVARIRESLKRDGFDLKEIWPENRWIVDEQGNEIPTAFVLVDIKGRKLDVHVMDLDKQGNGIPMWYQQNIYPINAQHLSGKGEIAGYSLRCASVEKQMISHSGYDLPDKQIRDLELLQKIL